MTGIPPWTNDRGRIDGVGRTLIAVSILIVFLFWTAVYHAACR